MKIFFLSIVLVIISSFYGYNQTTCATAILLTPGTQQCGTNSNVGSFPDDGSAPTNPCDSYYNDGEYWFKFVGTGQALQLSVSSLTATYSGIFVLNNCPASSPTCIASYVDGSSTSNYSVTTPALTTGTTYYIVIANWSTPYSTSFCLNATLVAPPAPMTNDECATAISITPSTSCSYTTYNNTGATASSGAPAPSCSSYSGGDVWFKVVVPLGGHLIIDTQTGGITDGGMAIYSGTCGALTEIQCNDDGSTNGAMPMIDASGLTVGSTIYIRFWEYGGDVFGTFGLCVYYPAPPPVQPPCSNLGFESGITGWYGTIGESVDGATGAASPVYTPLVLNTTSDPNITIMTSGTDPLAGFPVVFSGTSSLRLGDVSISETYSGASVEQTFPVTATNSDFIYNYAVVLEDGGHANNEQPFFQVDIYDQSGNPITCGMYLVAAPGTGFTQIGTTATYYKPWTTISVNLVSYIGQNVTVRFTASDCSLQGHYGYAYIDCSCSPYGIINPSVICSGQSTTLTAPAGAAAYLWSPGGATTQSITVSPTTTTPYTCSITTTGTTPCYFTLTTTVTVNSAGSVTASSNSPICAGTALNLTSLPAGGTAYNWSGPSFTNTTQNPTIASATPVATGTYLVTVTFAGGCFGTASTAVTVNPLPVITAPANITVCSGSAVPAGSIVSTPAGATYAWTNSNTSIGLATSGTGQVPAFTGTNATSAAITGTITVTPTIGTCVGAPITYTITINPLPVITAPANITVCSGSAIPAGNIVSTPAGATYAWTNSNTSIGLAASGTGQVPAFTGTNATSAAITGTITVTPTIGTCAGTPITYTITINPLPVITAPANITVCSGSAISVGNIASTPAGATYAWTNSNTSIGLAASGTGQVPAFTGTNATSVAITGTITVTPTIGTCIGAPITYVITINPTDNPAFNYTPSTLCQTGSDPAANITGGATGTFTASPAGLVLLNTTTGVIDVSASAINTYTVTFTTNGTCPSSTTTNVTITTAPIATFNYSGPYCSNVVDPSPTFAVGASAGVFSAVPAGLVFVNTSTGQIDLSASIAGTYTVTNSIAASGGCVAVSATASITITALPTATISYTGSPWCTSAALQAITLTGTGLYTGGTYSVLPAGLTINSSTGQITPSTSTAGIYSVTYTIPASGGCAAVTATTSVTIAALPTAAISYTGSPWCVSAAVQTVTLTGTGSYTGGTYSVLPTGLTINSSTGQVTPSTSTTGIYNVTYTILASGGCAAVTATTSVTVNPLDNPAFNYTPSTMCQTGTDAAANITGGATGTFTTAPTGLVFLDNTTGLIDVSASSINTYTITFNTSGICPSSSTAVLNITSAPSATFSYGGPYCTTDANPLPTFPAGSSSGVFNASPAGLVFVNTSTGEVNLTSSTPGTYTVSNNIASAGGCAAATATNTITINPIPTVTVPANINICYNGAVSSTNFSSIPAGGTFTWTNNNTAIGLSASGTGDITGFNATNNGTAPIIATITVIPTVNGCVGTPSSYSITVNPKANVTVPADIIVCNGDAIPGTTFTSSVAGSTYTWTNDNPLIGLAASGTGDISGFTAINAGGTPITATITVTPSAYSCPGTASTYTITVNPTPAANAGTDQIICFGQSANLTAFGGGSYLWSNNSQSQSTNVSPATTTTYIVTVTLNGCTKTDNVMVTVNSLPLASAGADQTICKGDTAQFLASGGIIYAWSPVADLSNPSIANPKAYPQNTTTYSVTVTDNNGCSAIDGIVLTVNPFLVVSAGSDQVLCLGQNFNIQASGGLNYSWSPSTGLSATNISNPVANPVVTTSYTVTASDANGCSNTDDITITVNPVPTSDFSLTSPVCVGQSTSQITYTGTGTASATYNWDFAGGTVVSGSGQGPYQVNWTSPSTYNVNLTVTENNCTSTITTHPVIVGQTLISLAITDSISCYGDTNGIVTVTPTGFQPFQYSWSDMQTGSSAINLDANTPYIVTVTDANGCSASQSITLSEPQPLSINLTTHNVTCFAGNNGSANAIVSGGSKPYSYIWTPSSVVGNVNAIEALTEGIYTFQITDAHGCTADSIFTITQPTQLMYSYTTDSVSCYFGNDGSIAITPSGSNPPYGFIWSPSVSASSSATGLSAGIYSVTITDHNGCDTSTIINIFEPPQLTLTTSGNTVICNGQSTIISSSASGGTGSYTFTWDNGLGIGNSFSVSPTVTTTYSVSVTDGNSCTLSPQTLTVSVSPPIFADVIANPSVVCFGDNAVLNTTASGGNGNYTYTWGQGIGVSSQTITVTPSQTTMYPVTVTDNCGSPQGVDSAEVIVNPLPTVQFSSDIFNGCEPLVVSFTDNSTPSIGSWNWNFGDPSSGSNNNSTDQTPSHMYSLPGTYTVSLIVQTTEGCDGSITNQNMIEVYPNPVAEFTFYPDQASIIDPEVQFSDLSSNAFIWNWNFGDPLSVGDNSSTEQNPTHVFSDAGTYTIYLIVTSPYGCMDSVTNSVHIAEDFTFYAPSGFTPNGNGKNDVFLPLGIGWDLDNYQLYIYDRWGEEIFKTNSYNKGWDGKVKDGSEMAPLGVYVWLVNVKDKNGELHTYSGRVTLTK
jgi:gliding motility-associated-like protein